MLIQSLYFVPRSLFFSQKKSLFFPKKTFFSKMPFFHPKKSLFSSNPFFFSQKTFFPKKSLLPPPPKKDFAFFWRDLNQLEAAGRQIGIGSGLGSAHIRKYPASLFGGGMRRVRVLFPWDLFEPHKYLQSLNTRGGEGIIPPPPSYFWGPNVAFCTFGGKFPTGNPTLSVF